MEDAKALLDSLMGQTRDVPLKEARKKKGNNFKEPDTCKFYLLGFCPQYEDIFKNTKKGHLQLGECMKIHSEALKTEFENHPDKADYERTYSRDLLRYLEGITKKADDAVARQSSKLEAKSIELFGDVAKREIQAVRDQASAALAQAEELAESGDMLGCKTKRELYETTLKRAEEYEAKAKEDRALDFCAVCGLRLETADEVHGVQVYDHNQGRVHLGFVKIRAWIGTLRKRIEELEEERRKKREDGGTRKEESVGADRGGTRKEESVGADRGDGSKQGNRGRDRDNSNRDTYRRDDRGGDRDYNDREGNDREGKGNDREGKGRDRRRDRGYGDDYNDREVRGNDRDGIARDRGRDRGYSDDYNDREVRGNDRDGIGRDRGRDRDFSDRDSYRRESRARDQDYNDRNDYGYEAQRDDRYDRRGNRGRENERGYDGGRLRSRSGMRRR